MKKIYGLLISIFAITNIMGQIEVPPTIVINPADTALVNSSDRRNWAMREPHEPITINGIKDANWDLITPKVFDRFILGKTTYENGSYGMSNLNRLPIDKNDFSGSYRFCYDEDYIYTFFDITDDEINDGVLSTGLNEQLQIFAVPYPNSAQQILQGKPYPSDINDGVNYAGLSKELSKKYLYWGYLGALKINFSLIADGKCKIAIDTNANEPLMDFKQREQSCHCAWKRKIDSSGYILEAAISLKIAMADSTGQPLDVYPSCQNTQMAFDVVLTDRDLGKAKNIKASWNAQNDNVWDLMLYTGELSIFNHRCYELNTENQDELTFSPNPATDLIHFKNASTIQIISMNGILVASATNATELNISGLTSGIYVVIIDGAVAGKLQKE